MTEEAPRDFSLRPLDVGRVAQVRLRGSTVARTRSVATACPPHTLNGVSGSLSFRLCESARGKLQLYREFESSILRTHSKAYFGAEALFHHGKSQAAMRSSSRLEPTEFRIRPGFDGSRRRNRCPNPERMVCHAIGHSQVVPRVSRSENATKSDPFPNCRPPSPRLRFASGILLLTSV
jgi:hypothetical protein